MGEFTKLLTPKNLWQYASAANITLGTSFTDRGPLSTEPAAISGESAIVQGGENGIHIKPYGSVSGGTIEIRVLGWNRHATQDTEKWEEILLFEGTATMRTVSKTVNGATMYAMSSIVQNAGLARISNAGAYLASGSFYLDTNGSEWVEIGMYKSSGSPTANASFRTT